MSRQVKADEVVELLFDDDFGVSEGDSSDKDGDGVPYLLMLVNSILTQQRSLL